MVIMEMVGKGVISAAMGAGTAGITDIIVGEGIGSGIRLAGKVVGAGCSAVAGGEPGKGTRPLNRKITASITPAARMPMNLRREQRCISVTP
jgi:hypothetical protein